MSVIFEYAKDIMSYTHNYDFGTNNKDKKRCGLFVFEDRMEQLLENQEYKNINYQNEVSVFYIDVYERLLDVNEALMENYYDGYKETIINFEDDIEILCDSFDINDSKKLNTKIGLQEYKMKTLSHVRDWLIDKNSKLGNKADNKSPGEFVEEKHWSEEHSEVFGLNNTIQEYILKKRGNNFKLEVKKSGVWIDVEKDYSSHVIAIQEISESMLAHKMRKHPKIGKELKKVLLMSNYKTEDVMRVADKIISQKQVFKNKDVDILEYMRGYAEYKVERLEDEIDYIIELNSVEKFALSIMSNKYKHLAIASQDEECHQQVRRSDFKKNIFESFKLLEESGVSKSDLQKYIGVKLEKYKSSEELEEGLDTLNSMVNSFTADAVIKKLNKYNTSIVVQNDNILIAEIHDFYSSKKVGSQSWCISSYESNWDDYVGKDNRQFFIYNFQKDAKKSDSMIGVTLSFDDASKKYIKTAAHYKDDEEVEEDSFILSRYIKSINKSISPIKTKTLKIS